MLPDETKADSFTEFVVGTETRLRHALTAAFGPERGREGAAEALAYGWEHWDRIGKMENPAGYLYQVGRDHARRMTPRRVPVSRRSLIPNGGSSRGFPRRWLDYRKSSVSLWRCCMGTSGR